MFLVDEKEGHRVTALMSEWYDINVRAILGGSPGDDEGVTILNRRVSWRNGAIEYEADSKHAEVIGEGMGLQRDSKGLESPCEKDVVVGGETAEDEELPAGEATQFRGMAATANYLALDRTDIQYAAKEVCRCMSKPTGKDREKLKRLARYLLVYSRLVLEILLRSWWR